MRRYLLASLLIVVAACAKPEVREPTDDSLVLELGGTHKPLGSQLQAAGSRTSAGDPAAAHADSSGVAVLDASANRIVELQKGQTIIGLSRTHLGNAGRWREIVALNGWSDEQLRHLPVGTRVRLPAQ